MAEGYRNLAPRLLAERRVEYLLEPVAAIDRTMPVIDLPDARPFATGNGPHDYLCGTCRNVLLSRVDLPRPQRVMIVCGRCRAASLLEIAAG